MFSAAVGSPGSAAGMSALAKALCRTHRSSRLADMGGGRKRIALKGVGLSTFQKADRSSRERRGAGEEPRPAHR